MNNSVIARKILLIEDNDYHREIVVEYLNAMGYSICAFSQISEILSLLQELQPDLILLDLKLPGSSFDGFEILEILQNSSWEDIPVIVVSAFSFPADKERAKKLGARHFLVKPTTLQNIYQVIEEELS